MAKRKASTTPVEPVVETNDAAETVTTMVGVVTNCERLRIRKKPSLEADVLTIIDAGTKLTVTQTVDTDWNAVVLGDGTKGFASSKFISIE